MRQRSKAALIALPLALLAAGHLAKAQDKPAESPPAAETTELECRGRDMLPEIKASDPKTYAKLEEEARAAQNGSAVLWRIERAGLPHSYVFGTVHLTDDRVTALSDKVRDAIGTSRAVLLEAADLSAEATAHALAQATKSTIFTDGRSLETMLTSDEFEKVRATLTRAGVPVETAHVYRPWVITMLIAASDCERRKIQNGALVLDMKVAAEARERGIPVAGLETIGEQLAAMTSVPDEQQVGMLRASLKFADRTDDMVETMVRLYIERRIGATWGFQLALAAQAGVGAESFEGFKQKLIVERNLRMRDAALPYLKKGGAFIAVGALHLPGEEGLVELLRKAGYTAVAVE